VSRATRTRKAGRPAKTLGRPSPLTDRDKIDQFLDFVEEGNHITTAAARVGIGQSTIYTWLSQAEDAQALIAEANDNAARTGAAPPNSAQLVTPHALRAMEFSDRLARARAKAEVKVVASIGKAIHGGVLLERKPALTGDGLPIYDEEGNLTYEEKWSQPDGKLGLEFLSRARPNEWAKAGPTQVEISGPGGAPILVENTAQIATLAERLAEHLAIAAAGPLLEIEGSEPVDAELVEESESA
jgi:transposase